MAKFSTPYDTLVHVRRIEEDKAKAALSEANLTERTASGLLATRMQEYPTAVCPPDAETDVASFRRHHSIAHAAASSVTQAHRGVEEAREATGQALSAVRAASTRTQGLERLVERARDKRLDELLTADQRAAEESATRRKKGR